MDLYRFGKIRSSSSIFDRLKFKTISTFVRGWLWDLYMQVERKEMIDINKIDEEW